MRLSLVDHEDHQRKMVEEVRGDGTPPGGRGVPSSDSSRRPSIGLSSPLSGGAATPTKSQGPSSSAASKLFSKLGGRSRSGSSASATGLNEQRNVTFAAPPTPTNRNTTTLAQASTFAPTSPSSSRTPPSSFNPTMAVPVAPIMTPADSTSISNTPLPASAGLPQLSLDMAPLSPDSPGRASAPMTTQRAPFQRADTELSEAPSETGGRPAYAQLDSDDE